MLVLSFALSIHSRGPRGTIPIGWGHEIIYNFLFAMIMFAIFTLMTALLDKHTKIIKEWEKILLSFIVSGAGGFFVSWIVWAILFRIFHG